MANTLNSYNYDPYGGQKPTGGAVVNGTRGSQTPGSLMNADAYSRSKGDPYLSYGNLSNAWSKALSPKSIETSPSVPSAPSGRRMTGLGGATGYGPYNAPMTTYGTPGGTTTSRPRPSVPGVNPMWQPFNDRRTYRSGPNGEVYDTSGPPPQGGTQFQPYNFDFGYGPGMVPTFRGPNGEYGGPPSSTPDFGSPGAREVLDWPSRPGTLPPQGGAISSWSGGMPLRPFEGEIPQELRKKRQIPLDRSAVQPIGGGGFNTNISSDMPYSNDDVFRPLPAPYTGGPQTRPPATPSTQPSPAGRPPARPSTQPPPQGGTLTPAPYNGNPFDPSNPGVIVTYRGPNGEYGGGRPAGPSSTPDFGSPGAREVLDWPWTPPGNLPPQGGALPTQQGRRAIGIDYAAPSSPFGPEFGPDGKLLTNSSVGVRWKDRSGGAPPEFQGAGGYPVQNWIRVNGPNGMQTVLADYQGNPIYQNGSMVVQSRNGAVPGPATGVPPTGGGTGTGGLEPGMSSTTTGTFGAPNNTTTFDPNTLPSSNVGDWFDPVARDAMDKVSRQLRHEASLTGLTNSGGYVPGMAEALSPLANQLAAQKGNLQFEDQNRKADRLLDKYKFDNTQQLTQWIENNRNELERYGIDTNALVSRYQSDQSLKAAGLGADASRFAARMGADTSRNNAWLDFMQGMTGIGANYGLGQDRLGYDYWNTNQNLGFNAWDRSQQRAYDDMFNQRGYDLGVYGINRDVYGMDQAQQRYLMDLMWRMSPGGQMGGGNYFPLPSPFPYGG